MTAGASARRGLLRRPLLLFALLLLGPAAGFVLLGWRSVLAEETLRRQTAEREAESILQAEVDRAVAGLEALRRVEEERPYFQYQSEFVSPEVVAESGVALQESPFASPSHDPRILGWFQWEAGAHGVPPAPEAFGATTPDFASDLVQGYGPLLRERLEQAPTRSEAPAVRRVEYPLWLVKGNEERGLLFEEIQLANTQRRQAANAAPNAAAQAPAPAAGEAADGARRRTPSPAGGQPAPQTGQSLSPYLQSFYQLGGGDPVPVRYTPFRYLARRYDRAGAPLIAWRLVFVPGVHPEKRERARDRWMVQGYALDPSVRPGAWVQVGPVSVCRGDCPPPGAATATHRSLVAALSAEVAGDPVDARLVWGAYPDPATWLAEGRTARQRFFLLVGALLAVTTIGFAFLLRGVRRELALARKKEDFVAAITHELKTPLTGIRMYAEMLREGWAQDEEAARRQAQRILDESGRLEALVDQVLDLAALDRGILRANLARGDLAGCVRAAAESMAPKAREAGVAYVVDVPGGVEPVPYDERLLRPLVLNLVDNAIKHGGRGDEKDVRVVLRVEEGHPVLRVADRGPGIPREVLGRPFAPFQRGASEMTRATTGIGIGLALVRRYADALGATLAIASGPGGTTVSIRF